MVRHRGSAGGDVHHKRDGVVAVTGHIKNLAGRRIGLLTVLENVPGRKWGQALWKVRCDCGTEKVLSSGALTRTRTCGCGHIEGAKKAGLKQRGANNSKWKGGRQIDEGGYVRLTVPGGGYVKEHRMVMEEILGRPLTRNEEVHHKNGNRSDNRPENLELWVINQPPGQRVADLIKWAEDILRTYGPLNEVK
jgi:hypothetical protein